MNTVLENLKQFDLFSNVGNRIEDEKLWPKVIWVTSWKEAVKWSKEEITIWCRIEAGNLLMSEVRKNDVERFNDWNKTALNNHLKISEFLKELNSETIPCGYVNDVKRYFNTQLAGALLELSYADCSKVELLTKQIEIYEKGNFPCGWFVADPKHFPQNSTLVIF